MRQKGMLRTFPSVFWIANVMELFERAAYYGMNSVLAVYLTARVAGGGRGFSEESVGFLQAIIYTLTYVIPIIGGALAEKFGYRRMLIIAFVLISAGYMVTGHISSYTLIFCSLGLMALGAGLFKPIISGTIARSTNEKNSGFGFGVYYMVINLGAFLAPLVVSKLRAISWKWVFVASAIYTTLMLLPALFLFRDPELPGRKGTLRETAKNAVIVLSDARFMLMIFIYSCFWILYFQEFGSILFYMRDFIDKQPVNALFSSIGLNFRFGEEHVMVIAAGTITLLQMIVSRLVRDRAAIPTMCSGMLLGVAGFTILALSRSPWIFILGIIVFSIGEMTAHPKYYSYIGIIAPQDQKAIYMGYSFLYGVIGSLFGSSSGAFLYTQIAKPGNPALFFLIFALIGLIGFIGLILFNRYLSDDTPATNQKARLIVRIFYILLILAACGLIWNSLSGQTLNPKMLVQAILLLIIGGGGLLVMFLACKSDPSSIT